MKKKILLCLIALVTSVCYAQKQEDLHFLDIPIGGSLDDFCSKLVKEKGLVNSIMTEGEQYYQMETRKLWTT